MVNIRPFKAIRPTRDKASLLASRSYLSYTDETLKEKLRNNPYTFLHIINPENKKIGVNKFKRVKSKFNDFINNKYLIQDTSPAYYIYEQTTVTHKFEGIIGCVAVDDYLNNHIRKHEKTISDREKMFKDYLKTTGFNADPVLLSYKEDNLINSIINKYKITRSEYEFTTSNQTLHKLWIVNNKDDINKITNRFKDIQHIYIADGHHRCASSALLNQHNSTDLNKYFMSFLINENLLNIINFNRLVIGLNNLSVNSFLKKISKKFNIQESNECQPNKKNEIGMYIDKRCYILELKRKSVSDNCVNNLSTAILSNNILNPILNIIDAKSNNLSFESGNIPLSELKKKIDNKEYNIAFILRPISIETIKKVADQNLFMPPKSTYIEPKLRSGLTIYALE